MSSAPDAGSNSDPFDLQRFVDAQNAAPDAWNSTADAKKTVYETALCELKKGSKRTHWMWFIFPQLAGLGRSEMVRRYAIHSREEARQYVEHPMLGQRLNECAEAVLAVEGRSARAIFDSPDDMKLHSSMTLFAAVAGPESVFARVLGKYYAGMPDASTLALLRSHG